MRHFAFDKRKNGKEKQNSTILNSEERLLRFHVSLVQLVLFLFGTAVFLAGDFQARKMI